MATFRKSHEGAPLNSQRLGRGSEKIGLGVILDPLVIGSLSADNYMPHDRSKQVYGNDVVQ